MGLDTQPRCQDTLPFYTLPAWCSLSLSQPAPKPLTGPGLKPGAGATEVSEVCLCPQVAPSQMGEADGQLGFSIPGGQFYNEDGYMGLWELRAGQVGLPERGHFCRALGAQGEVVSERGTLRAEGSACAKAQDGR